MFCCASGLILSVLLASESYHLIVQQKNNSMKRYILLCLVSMMAFAVEAQHDTVRKSQTLEEVTVRSRAAGVSRLGGAENGIRMEQDELFRAACCNLGESFVANPSVDVTYSDAAVGARQIKLLGLSGQYVQMLLEGLPMQEGSMMPYQLDYVPGAWMRSISVSKGTSSVKQGFQSITGQINVEYLKPDEDQGIVLNLYGDSRMKTEGNAAGNIHLNKYLNTEILVHGEKDFAHHDANGDGWHDAPSVSQYHLQNRWKYQRGRYIGHAGAGYMDNYREGGQLKTVPNRYMAEVNVQRKEAYMKHAYLLNREHNTNVALMGTVSQSRLSGVFGDVYPEFTQRDYYAQMLLEHDFTEVHSFSTGLSYRYENHQTDCSRQWEEATPGVYGQYTFKPSYRFTLMVGLRADRYMADESMMFVTPRLHVKWLPNDRLSFRISAGKGYRTVHPMEECHYLLASGRTLTAPDILTPEEAWNSGVSVAYNIPVDDRMVRINGEYYYTHFLNQAVVDYDSDPHAITISDLEGVSFSHTAQVDVSCEIGDEWEAMAAFRYNHVRCTYQGKLLEKPLTSRYKGLLTLSWKPMMGLWQVDATLQVNGGGRMPKAYLLYDGSPSWADEFPAYPQLNAQVTRTFRRFSVYMGGENLTNYKQPNPIINASDPWSADFEPTMIWGPVHGIMFYAGLRVNLWRE